MFSVSKKINTHLCECIYLCILCVVFCIVCVVDGIVLDDAVGLVWRTPAEMHCSGGEECI